MSEYTPDKWAIVEIRSPSESIYKVMASWYGGYLGSDSWKISSGIVSVTNTEDGYEFLNHSGSIYKCHKSAYGMSGYTASIYLNLEKQNNEEIQIRALKQDEAEGLKFT